MFQLDLAAGETRELTLVLGEPRKHGREDFRVYGRFVRERQDDFAWENDRVAFRVYGPALETFAKEPLTSSAVDAWSKRTTRLVLNDWYLVDDYHRDHGEGGDFYPAGTTRGCGGSGLVTAAGLAVSRNFRASRVLASGPIRLVFELDYPAWDALPSVRETKRVTLDAGSHFNRFESFYTRVGEAGAGEARSPGRPASARRRTRRRRRIASGASCAPGSSRAATETAAGSAAPSSWIRRRSSRSRRPTGTCWSWRARRRARPRAGTRAPAGTAAATFPDVEAWDRQVRDLARRLASPLRVEVVAP